MSKSKRVSDSELTENAIQRGKEVLEMFARATVSGVSHPDLLAILKDVNSYWRDNYRPALTSFSCEAVGGQPHDADAASLMITILSAGLGIHDDIIDKSRNKHFRMTILGLHGLEKAVLAGDLFIVKALTSSKAIIEQRSPEIASYVLDEFEKFFIEVWEGEYMETLCRKNLETELDYYQNVLWKSTADTEACAKFGAVFGNGSSTETEALAEFGRRLGYMHRLMDDMKDSLGIEGNFFDRLEKESVPLPILHAAKSSNKNYVTIKSTLQKADISIGDAKKILKICFETGSLTYVQDLIKKNHAIALSKLRSLKTSYARNNLHAMAERCLSETLKLES